MLLTFHVDIKDNDCYEQEDHDLKDHDDEFHRGMSRDELDGVDIGHSGALEQALFLLDDEYERCETDRENKNDRDHDSRRHEVNELRIGFSVYGCFH